MKYRKIWLPIASAGGILFFYLCDYTDYPDAALAITFIWLYYAIFLIVTHSSVSVHRDANGDLVITERKGKDAKHTNIVNNENENNHENIKGNR